jgi:uncharacterized protein YmfQ (DUF2313 family)
MTFVALRTQEEQATVLARYLPDNQLWHDKNVDNTVLRKILLGLATQWLDFRNTVNEVYDNYDPTITTSLIEEWEGFVGIPDSCLGNTGTLEERRTNILLKLSGINATTAKQFETVASVLGFTVTVTNGIAASTFPLTFPIILLSVEVAPFTIIVNLDASLKPSGFPLTFPITLTSDAPKILECFFNKLKPANTIVVFRYI